MSVLEKIAYLQGRKDETPNQELAHELVTSNNKDGISEIAVNLFNTNRNIQSDCIKVLYEIGYLNPDMIAKYVDDFIKLLKSTNNRLVWGAMLALSTIADVKYDEIYKELDTVLKVLDEGSVIAVDNAIKVLATLAAKNDEYSRRIFPLLMDHLERCRPKEVPQHAESTFIAVNSQNQNEYIEVLRDRLESLTSTQKTRVNLLIKKLKIKKYR